MSKPKLGCERVGRSGEINFKQPRSVLQGLLNLFKIPTKLPSKIPKQLILASEARPGLSAKKIAARIIQRQSEAGLNVGPLGTGEISPAEIMERIRAEEIVNAITTEARVDVALKPGGTSTITATAGVLPVTGTAFMSSIQGGSALIT